MTQSSKEKLTPLHGEEPSQEMYRVLPFGRAEEWVLEKWGEFVEEAHTINQLHARDRRDNRDEVRRVREEWSKQQILDEWVERISRERLVRYEEDVVFFSKELESMYKLVRDMHEEGVYKLVELPHRLRRQARRHRRTG